MKKNFENIFRIIVLVQLTIILLILVFSKTSDYVNTPIEPNEIGRYKEIKTKNFNRSGEEMDETVRVLDTKTGEFVEP
jgi:hypothetical protein